MANASFKQYLRNNMLSIIISLVAILLCMIVLLQVKTSDKQCNEHWLAQIEKCHCQCIFGPPEPFNISTYQNPYELKNLYKNASWPG